MDDASDSQPKTMSQPNPFVSVPIEITVSVGKTRPLIRELVNLGENSVLTLDKRVEDPVELFVGDKLVARGLLEELDGDQAGQLAVRLTEIADFQNGLG